MLIFYKIIFTINGSALCWRWKVFLSPPELSFYYLSRVLAFPKNLGEKNFFSFEKFFPRSKSTFQK